MRIAWTVALAVALGVSGCGYSLRASLPANIKTVHVPVLENRTQEPGIEDFVTRALTEALVTSGVARISSNPAAADGVLEGKRVTARTFAGPGTSSSRTQLHPSP